MLIVGTGDGAYQVKGTNAGTDSRIQKTLDVPRVERVMQFDTVDGVFTATKNGLYHTLDGKEWTALDVPEETVYAVCVSPSGNTIYAGTRPPYLYVSPLPDSLSDIHSLQWRKLQGFQELPSRDEWGVPRHNNIAQVRDICIHPETPQRLIVGVEPGGVHVSEDNGETWSERKNGVHNDIHELHMTSDGKCIASTGVGLYRTLNAGQTWNRLDTNVEQQYFRAAQLHKGVLYSSAACVPPNRWEEPNANPTLFECRDGATLERVESPCPDEVIVGLTVAEGDPLGVTHQGTLLRKQTTTWNIVGEIPSPDTLYGRFGNLTWYDTIY